MGRWSAEYALLRGLGRLEVFPGDDVGARNNLARRLGLASPLDYDDVRRAVAPWAPYAGLAYFHLLVERIDDAGWLDGGEAPDDRAEATFRKTSMIHHLDHLRYGVSSSPDGPLLALMYGREERIAFVAGMPKLGAAIRPRRPSEAEPSRDE